MDNYWDRWFAAMAKDLQRQRDLYEEFQRDNRLLRKLVDQNAELRRLLAAPREAKK